MLTAIIPYSFEKRKNYFMPALPQFNDPRKAAAICLAAEGKLQKHITQELKLYNTQLWEWKCSDAVFAEHFERAQEYGSDMQVEALEELARTEPNPKRAQVIANIVQWRNERRFRKKWAPSVDLNVNQSVDISGALIEARRRAVLPGCDLPALPNVQDAEYTMIPRISATDLESDAVRLDSSPPEIDPFS